jgi:hypothetical protein
VVGVLVIAAILPTHSDNARGIAANIRLMDNVLCDAIG